MCKNHGKHIKTKQNHSDLPLNNLLMMEHQLTELSKTSKTVQTN
jgi:hypothetical protein